MVEEGDTDTAPYGLGTYASRRHSRRRQVLLALAARTDHAKKAKKIAAHMMEASEDDVEWKDYLKFNVKGVPG